MLPLLCCAVLSLLLQPFSLPLRDLLIVCCAFRSLLLLPGGCLRVFAPSHLHCVATLILDSLLACIAICIPPLRLEQKSGSKTQDPASQSHHPATPLKWGMSRCSTSTIASSRAHHPRSEPRGLSHILNPSESGETQQHAVSGRPFGAYEENGRLYHSWRRGTYPYPTDEVSHAASSVA